MTSIDTEPVPKVAHKPARSRFQFRLHTLLGLIAIIAVFLGLWIAIDRILVRAFGGGFGPVIRDEWPAPLHDVLDNADGIEYDESTIQVYCLGRGFDPEFVWRMDDAPGLFAYLERRWELSRVAEP